jgi:hypothetical protein
MTGFSLASKQQKIQQQANLSFTLFKMLFIEKVYIVYSYWKVNTRLGLPLLGHLIWGGRLQIRGRRYHNKTLEATNTG